MLEPVREFGLECLAASGDEEAVRQAHAGYYLALAEALRPRIEGPEGPETLRRFDGEHPNLQAALRWAVDRGASETALRLVRASWKFWHVRGFRADGRAWFDAVLAMPGGPDEAKPEIRYAASGFALGDGNVADARRHAEAGLALARTTGSAFFEHALLVALGRARATEGRLEDAAAMYEEARTILAPILTDMPFAAHAMAMLLADLGTVALYVGRLESARASMEEALAIWRRRADRWGIGIAEINLGAIAAAQGNLVEAAEFYRDGIGMHWETGDAAATAEGLTGLARLAAAAGLTREAARLIGGTRTLGDPGGLPGPSVITVDRAETIAGLERALGEEAFARAVEAGRAMSGEEVVALAESLPAAILAATMPTPQARAASAPGSLSRRELEVLRLVAEGKSDAEAADELFIARRTVTSHLTSIYNKLGVDNRAAAAVYATRNGLI
jgi:DNA-binding CsgD family transcriptional regulator/tetratricopeptide (TPR) repeat protein